MPYPVFTSLQEALVRYGLLAYFLVYVALAFGWRSFVVYRSTGVNPFVLPSSDDAYGYVGRAFKAVVGAYAAVVLLCSWRLPTVLPPFWELGRCLGRFL